MSPVSQAVAADRAQINADLLQFKADVASACVTLLKDCQALQLADLKGDATLAPLFTTLHTNVTQMQQQLQADCLAQSSAVLKDQSVIVAELKQIVVDKGNPTALKADKAALLADRIALQNDEIAGLNARIATRQSDYATIFGDLQAITTAVGNDTNASPALVAAANTFTTDRGNILNAMSKDLTKLQADRTQLVTDLTAMQSQ
jgi:hypothetical protein